MIGKHFIPFPEFYGHRKRGKPFDRIAFLKVVLAYLRIGGDTRELPEGGCIIQERIGKYLGSFVGESRYVLKSGGEEPGRDPTRELRDPARLGHYSGIGEEGVETNYTATCDPPLVVDGKQKRVGQ